MKAKNAFIVASQEEVYLKMVKIRVTGERTFEWLAAKYDTNYSVKCTTSSNFSEQCFKGTSVTQAMYNVELVATANKGMAFF